MMAMQEDKRNDDPVEAESASSSLSRPKDHDSRQVVVRRRRVDLVRKLSPFIPVIRRIFSYLSPDDLRQASCVSKHWNKMIERDTDAYFRKVKYIMQQMEFVYAIGKVSVSSCPRHCLTCLPQENLPDLLRAPLKKPKDPTKKLAKEPKKDHKPRKGLSIIKGVNFNPSRC